MGSEWVVGVGILNWNFLGRRTAYAARRSEARSPLRATLFDGTPKWLGVQS